MAYTTIDDPSAHFQTLLYTGNGSHPRNLTNDGNSDLKPDLIWTKNRTDAGTNNVLTNSTVGFDAPNSNGGSNAGGHMSTDSVGAENTPQATYGYISAHLTDGFTTAAGGTNGDTMNANGKKFVAWQWKVNAGTTSSNTTGGINSTVQVNATAGISIFKFTADGTANTIGHGLGSKPDLVIFKSRNVGGGHLMATDLLDGGMDYLYLNLANAAASLAYAVPTSTVVEYNDNNTNTQVAYAFKNIQGYSKFGTYYGNGIADGTFAYCGFKPAFVMIKNTGSSEPWVIFDTKRDPYHQPDAHNKLVANSTDAENGHSATGGSGYNNIDMLSTGFKVVTNNGATNESGKRFLFMAFAESPFVSSEGIPTTGR